MLNSKAKYDSEFETILGYDAIEPKTDDGRAMVAIALQTLEASLAPCPPAVIVKAITRLKLSVNHRNQDADDAKYQRAIYVEELSEFPEDVVVEALCKLGRRDWFPNIGECRDACQHLVRWRRLTRDALEKVHD